jgi:hypothetical protein
VRACRWRVLDFNGLTIDDDGFARCEFDSDAIKWNASERSEPALEEQVKDPKHRGLADAVLAMNYRDVIG